MQRTSQCGINNMGRVCQRGIRMPYPRRGGYVVLEKKNAWYMLSQCPRVIRRSPVGQSAPDAVDQREDVRSEPERSRLACQRVSVISGRVVSRLQLVSLHLVEAMLAALSALSLVIKASISKLTNKMTVEKRHILAITFPAFGHAIPMFELCRKLSHFHDITYAVSASVAEKLRPREFRTLQADEPVDLVPIEDGIPSQRLMTSDDLLEAHDMIMNYTRPGITRFIQQQVDPRGERHPASPFGAKKPVTAIIFDMFVTPAVMGVRLPGVLYFYFNPSPAGLPRYILLFNDEMETCPLEQQDPYYTLPAAGEKLLPQSEMNIKEIRPIAQYLPQVDGMICNSFRAIDAEDIQELQKEERMKDVRFFCLGPFISPSSTTTSDVEAKVLHWLDQQATRSVVFVSFGSMAVPKPEEIRAIGEALAATGRPFIWSLRKGHEQHLPEDVRSEISGEEFNGKRYLVLSWAPQKAILAHPATGLFFSHCGWNSGLEAMHCGVPVLAWPMWADQRAIGQLFVKVGAGVLIEGTSCTSVDVVQREVVEKALGRVLGGDGYYQAAQALRQQIQEAFSPTGTSQTELQQLLQFIDQRAA